jgi:poly-gamma-glutamate synthesis protein (capsule biosynthesis protein)
MSPFPLLLGGDVMVGRGVDQILAYPSPPGLHEPHVDSARTYVTLAEERGGPMPRAVDDAYLWGTLLEDFTRSPDQVTVVNLETALTTSEEFSPEKEIHYRTDPRNIGCLRAARIGCCSLANNHVLDWGVEGLLETLSSLDRAGLHHAGAGRTLEEASRPAVIERASGGRVLVFGIGSRTSGIPSSWAAGPARPGLFLLDASPAFVDDLGGTVRRQRRPGDVTVASIHWGGNWGFDLPEAQRAFAHRLVDEAGIDVVHGHSSHHPMGIEVYHGRLVLYGCGDLLNDYEGIGGHDEFRPHVGVLYRASVDPSSGRLVELSLKAVTRRRFQLQPASGDDLRWLANLLDREGRSLGTHTEGPRDVELIVVWPSSVGPAGGPRDAHRG